MPVTRREFLAPNRDLGRDYDVLFVDTEFSRLPHRHEGIWDWARSVELLSVGITALDSVEPLVFYATRRLTPQIRRVCSSFVTDEVLLHLDAVASTVRFDAPKGLGEAMTDYLRARSKATGKLPAFAVDWAGDAWLLDPVAPSGTPWILLEDLPGLSTSMDTFFSAQQAVARHNAYSDAQALRSAYLKWREGA
ncbi:hypothetical protein [Solimonas terrae]|uniref:Uncharacterized protein n=1 Tax=Solimonas terrae TaxID=1396819 RepID=A0A6M2BTT0_9GAMM|nr:hypothetical protein [Solimonas terrae]NGY05621.1 hypothetical protein [Solimonas terrae]